jgi:hypothetical protein
MIPVSAPAVSAVSDPPSVPGWALPRRPVTSDVEAAFLAGSALTSLDNLVRAAPAWSGAWRQRQALTCAVAAMRLAGRSEDEAGLRDAFYLRQPGDALGPAGSILSAWKRLASRSPALDGERLRGSSDLLGIRWSVELASVPDRVDGMASSGMPAPFVAAAIAADVYAMRPDAEFLAWWLADLVLAQRLRWPFVVPLLIGQVHGAAFRLIGGRRRIQPGGEGFERAVCLATAQGAAEALREAAGIARRAARLAEVAPRLRAKGAGEVIQMLLEDDAVPGTLQTATLSRWASRRLFDRLTELEVVRELSGRATFRLFGL